MALSQRLNKIYSKYYYTPSLSSALGGVATLKRKLRTIQKEAIAKNTQLWLSSQDPYTLHKPIKKKFERRKTIVGGMREQLQVDLIDAKLLKQENDGFCYIVTAIDVFSKKAWAIPIKYKSGTEVAEALNKILRQYPVNACQTDKGSEFYNAKVKAVFDRYDINHFSTRDDTMKASIVERWNKTLQNAMYRWFTRIGNRRYIDVLQDLVDAYNDRFHRSIGMTPNQVTYENQEDVWLKLYPPRVLKHKPRLKVGDHIRISKLRMSFERGYTPNWSYEIFKINKVLNTDPITYEIKDAGGEAVEGCFYEEELQKVMPPEKYKIEEILAEKKVGRKKFYLIKWLGYPEKFNQWIQDKHITAI